MKYVLSFLFIICLIACANEPKQESNQPSNISSAAEEEVYSSEDYITEEIDLIRFFAISLELNANLKLSYGDKQKVSITGPPNLMEKIQVALNKGKLTLFADSEFRKNTTLDMEIQSPGLNGVFLIGAGSAVVDGAVFKEEDATFVNRGVNNVEISNLDRNTFTFLQNGAGNAQLSGAVNDIRLYSNGAGNIDALKVEGAKGAVTIRGVGNTKVNASEELDVQVLGVGNVTYKGDPEITKTVKGVGQILKI